MRAVLVIESPTISAMPQWNQALRATELLIRARKDWDCVTPEDLSRCTEGVIVANAASRSGNAARMFEWLRSNPVRARTFGILPGDDVEMLRLGAEVMDDFLLWPVHAEELRQRLLKLLGPENENREQLTTQLALCNSAGKDPLSFWMRLGESCRSGPARPPCC